MGLARGFSSVGATSSVASTVVQEMGVRFSRPSGPSLQAVHQGTLLTYLKEAVVGTGSSWKDRNIDLFQVENIWTQSGTRVRLLGGLAEKGQLEGRRRTIKHTYSPPGKGNAVLHLTNVY